MAIANDKLINDRKHYQNQKHKSNTFILSPGSAGSLAKSMRSEMGESGSESGGVDGDNINVVIR